MRLVRLPGVAVRSRTAVSSVTPWSIRSGRRGEARDGYVDRVDWLAAQAGRRHGGGSRLRDRARNRSSASRHQRPRRERPDARGLVARGARSGATRADWLFSPPKAAQMRSSDRRSGTV